MTEPAPHTNLTERAQRWWAHIHQAVLVGKGLAVTAAIVAATFLVVEGYLAILHSQEHKLEALRAQTIPQVVQTAPLEKHLFKPDQKPLIRRTFKPVPLRPSDPLPRPPAPDATPAIPHPEITTKTAESGPVATVFDPQSPADASEISTKLGVDLDKYFLISERKIIPPLEYGATGIMVLAAGGGDAEFRYVENKRPVFDFKPVFELGGGGHWSSDLPGPLSKQWGAHVFASIEPARIGGSHIRFRGQLNFDPERDKSLSGRIDGELYWRFK